MGNDERYRWDRVAETWDSTTASRRNPHYHYYRTTDLLVVQLLRAANAQRALELGGGTAGCAIYALQALKKNADLHITSIDISPRMIELGQHKVKQAGLEDRITLQVGNASTLSYPNDSFDVVFSRGGVLSYSQHPEQLLQSAYRVLRVDGTLGIDVLPKPPEKKGYYLGKLEGFEKINGNCQNFQEPFTYREFFTEGEYQVLREYLIAPETQLSDEVKRQFQALPEHLPGITKRPPNLKTAKLIIEERTRLYSAEEIRQAVAAVGFQDIKIHGEGYATYLQKDEELRSFVDEHRNYFSKAEIMLHDKLNLDYAVMLFVMGWKR